MSTRKHLRQKVRSMAEHNNYKPSRAVKKWSDILGVYPGFKGKKRQPKGSTQPILKYPV